MFRTSALTRSLVAVALGAALGCNDDDDNNDPLSPDDAVLLTNGTPVTGLSGAEDNQRLYKIVVPAGQSLLTVTTEGGTGDVDLFVRLAAVPTLAGSDCISNDVDTNEYCEESNPTAGTWYILLDAWEDYADVTLTAEYVPPLIAPSARK